MNWTVSLFDGTNVNLSLDNSWLGQRGSWRVLNFGLLATSEGTFYTDTSGVNLMAPFGATGDPARVAALNNFWWISGTWANNSGTAFIDRPQTLLVGAGRWSLG